MFKYFTLAFDRAARACSLRSHPGASLNARMIYLSLVYPGMEVDRIVWSILFVSCW